MNLRSFCNRTHEWCFDNSVWLRHGRWCVLAICREMYMVRVRPSAKLALAMAAQHGRRSRKRTIRRQKELWRRRAKAYEKRYWAAMSSSGATFNQTGEP